MSALNDPTLFRFWHVVDPRFDEPLNIKPKKMFLKSQKYEENDIGSLIYVYEHAKLFTDFFAWLSVIIYKSTQIVDGI